MTVSSTFNHNHTTFTFGGFVETGLPDLQTGGLGLVWTRMSMTWSVLDRVSSLNDSRTLDETISRQENVAFIMKIKYICEFVNLVWFKE